MMFFFESLDRFADRVALIDGESSASVTYQELESMVSLRLEDLPLKPSLIFVEAQNKVSSLVDYLACLRGGHAVHLIESAETDKAKALIEVYDPNIIVGADRSLRCLHDRQQQLHADLRLLLSTSGSTGTPKFVKLSAANVHSNAASIVEYLQITECERAYLQLKPFYSYGLSVINSHLLAGASLVLSTRSIVEPEFTGQLTSYKATSLAGVPHTFETLLQSGFNLEDFPSLKTLTQAGGRLEPRLVAEYAKKCKELGKKFVVMYGQTEAAPRMSFLPPEFAEIYPDSIGKAIPGGELFLVGEGGQELVELGKSGELAYRGPNVMMGYATKNSELATDETPDFLLTGDLASRNELGLFFITGRISRFVKVFGLRINLDQIQSDLKSDFTGVAVAGNDRLIYIALVKKEAKKADGLLQRLARRYHLPEACFVLRIYDDLPLLPSGKYDFRQIVADGEKPQKRSFFSQIGHIVLEVLELNDKCWESILDLYRTVLSNKNITMEDSFDSLGADSLSYVTLCIEMEDALGKMLPHDWRGRKLADLDALYAAKRSAGLS